MYALLWSDENDRREEICLCFILVGYAYRWPLGVSAAGQGFPVSGGIWMSRPLTFFNLVVAYRPACSSGVARIFWQGCVACSCVAICSVVLGRGCKKQSAKGDQIQRPKASRGRGIGRGRPPSQPTMGSWERRKLSRRGPGQNSGQHTSFGAQ